MDVCDALEKEDTSEDVLREWKKDIDRDFPIKDISKRISKLCQCVGKGVILIVDEVDKSADNQIFLTFLGLLRDKYLKREQKMDAAFQSVILAGVYDVKNMKQKLRPEEEHKYNSPWNIAVPFEVAMDFETEDIHGMLKEYAIDHRIDGDLEGVAEEIQRYTAGYPFLVSRICQKMHDEGREWTRECVRYAVRDLVQEKNALFEDVIKNIHNNSEFAMVAKKVVVHGIRVAYDANNPAIELGITFGIFTNCDGCVRISNIIFETLILNYFTSLQDTSELELSPYAEREQYIVDGRLQMDVVLQRFAQFMREEYRDEDAEFVERQGRLLFLCFLRPLINGTGHYAVEPQTRKNNRMDIQVFYGGDEFIVELKIWHGEAYEEKAVGQLCQYLDARGVKKGYLLSFCGNKKQPREGRTFVQNGHEIYEVIVVYREA